jgi:histidinol-phosphate aminotransferase
MTHGGPDEQGVPAHDFSTNANACGPCPVALAAVQQADLSRYPDPGYAVLRRSLARFHGVEAQSVVLAASASEFVARMTAAVAQRGARSVWLPRHSYSEYERAARAWGLQVLRGAASPGNEAQLLWCCDPSSPLGQPQPDLGALVDGHAASQVCVLDLAYEPLRLDGRIALDAKQCQRVWQLWSPNKALGLAGVRAAYAIAPVGAEDLVARLEALAPSWLLGADGVALLAQWIGDEAQRWVEGSLPTLSEWKAAQIALCEGLGLACLPSDANFFCARVGARQQAVELLDALRGDGVKLRDAESFGLRQHVRLAVLAPASQRALARGLMQSVRKAGG